MKKPSRLFTILARTLSYIMCFMVAYNYRDMLCGVEHEGSSAPATISFLYAIPYLVAIIIFIILAIIFRKKGK